MITRFFQLHKYRQLVNTLVSRELKARYRGTVLGFFWSFMNPLLTVVVYSVVFGFIFKPRFDHIENPLFYSLFFFTGILPWTWFSSSLLESANVLIIHGNLIKKIQFPVEVLPVMVVITNMVHFMLGLPILLLSFLILGKPLTLWVLFLPIAVAVQFIFTLGLSLLISALTVHFRDIKDILTNLLMLWFFSTPIIYPFQQVQDSRWLSLILSLNPMTHIIEAYQYLFFFGELPRYKRLSVTALVGLGFLYLGYAIFDKLRDTYVEEV